MYTGFDLRIDEDSYIFSGHNYNLLVKDGEKHLNDQKAKYEKELKEYVNEEEIDGTKIQNEWFPQIEADIFISHSHNDKNLACALAGWINKTFGLKCFIDSNVWGYSNNLLKEMNDKLSDKRPYGEDSYLYDYDSCNQVSQHVNAMLSIALQKMIDKVEAVIFLNTDNSIKICSDNKMNKTYSPWIYSEIICTQLVRKKPLIAYRDYIYETRTESAFLEGMQFIMHTAISYTVSLEHLKKMDQKDLKKWKDEYIFNKANYQYALDALYEFMCPDEVENTKKLFGALNNRALESIKHAYSTQDINSEEWEVARHVWECIIKRGILCSQHRCYLECDKRACCCLED